MRRFISFIIVLSLLLAVSSCGHRSSDESSNNNNYDKDEYSDYSTESQMSSGGIANPDDEDDENGSDSDIDDGSLDFDNLDDGTYSATVSYYNPETGFSNSYDLDVEVGNNEVVQIDFPNGGYLTSSETVNSDGTCTVADDRGCTYDVQIEEQE